MALKSEEIENSQNCEYLGPSMATEGDPVNPSDEIFKGKALPIRQPQMVTVRRPFNLKTKPPLHLSEGDDLSFDAAKNERG